MCTEKKVIAMKPKFKINQHIHVNGEKHGSINEFARIDHVYKTNPPTYWIVNMNMPYSGTLSKLVNETEISER